MIKTIIYIGFFVLVLFCITCKKPYAPNVGVITTGYLVVEGVINTGTDSTLINLSRTTALTDTNKTKAETKATVYVEDDKNNKYPLKEYATGIYKCGAFNTGNIQNCRLHVITSGKSEYVSDYVQPISTPPIDSLTYTSLSTGIQLSAYTHDAANITKYYRWSFDETWEYKSYIQTMYKYTGGASVVLRAPTEQVYFCWLYASSNQILLANTEQLSQSVINAQPIAYVDAGTGKLQKGYSMLLKQYALTKDGYDYWQKLKKNTETLGSIFDAQPTQLTGNIHNISNAAEPVIGYISASTISTKRILIDAFNLKVGSKGYYPKPDADQCMLDTVYIAPAISFAFRLNYRVGGKDSTIVNPVVNQRTGEIIGYSYAPTDCVDCRVKNKNGTNTRPSFWPSYL